MGMSSFVGGKEEVKEVCNIPVRAQPSSPLWSELHRCHIAQRHLPRRLLHRWTTSRLVMSVSHPVAAMATTRRYGWLRNERMVKFLRLPSSMPFSFSLQPFSFHFTLCQFQL